MLIDGRKRLFGRINIFDMVVVIIVLIAVALLSFHFFGSDNSTGTVEKLKITFRAEEVPEIFAGIDEGYQVRLQKSDYVFGTVADVVVAEDMPYYGVSARGEWVSSPKPYYKSVTFVVEGSGKYSDGEAIMGDAQLSVGKNFSIVMGMTAYYAKVLEIGK